MRHNPRNHVQATTVESSVIYFALRAKESKPKDRETSFYGVMFMVYVYVYGSCNVLLTQSTGAFTIGNHGKNVNCSVSIMAPVKFQMMSASKDLSICRRPQKPSPLLEFLKRSSQFNEFLIRTYGYMNEIPKEEDCVEYRGGNNLNPMDMDIVPFTGYYFYELLFSSVLLFYKKALVSGFY
ncbi:hypothetical protein GQR58_022986 [Nymphon striatum]|nr:hypothetical protein GQR58_022986 [Nymphon striatum]